MVARPAVCGRLRAGAVGYCCVSKEIVRSDLLMARMQEQVHCGIIVYCLEVGWPAEHCREACLGNPRGWRSAAARASVCGVATSSCWSRRVGVLCRLGGETGVGTWMRGCDIPWRCCYVRLLVVATYSW